jgi:hypothetical protein
VGGRCYYSSERRRFAPIIIQIAFYRVKVDVPCQANSFLMKNSRVTRGEALLQKAVNQHKLSPTGLAAFEFAVDPFHDKPIDNLRGWPDRVTAPSVVRKFKQSYTVTSVEAGGSILIYSWPILNQTTLHTASRRNAVVDTVQDSVSTNTDISPVMVYRFNKLTADGDILPLVGQTNVAKEFTIPTNYFESGPCRLLGLGIEVHDVTADIYKQGTLTICEVPQSLAETQTLTVRPQTIAGVTYAQTSVEAVDIRRFPVGLDTMTSYPKSLQWDAKEGCYCVSRFDSPDNDPRYAEYRIPWVNSSASALTDRPATLNTAAKLIGQYAGGSVNGDNLVFTPNVFSPLDSKCIYLSGLNANSTFTVTVSYALECFPDLSSDLITLASSSSAFDPKALALISLVMKELPIGCPVADNPGGEWFWDTLETALPYLTGVAAAFFPEFALPIAGAAKLADSALQSRKSTTNKQTTQPPQQAALQAASKVSRRQKKRLNAQAKNGVGT